MLTRDRFFYASYGQFLAKMILLKQNTKAAKVEPRSLSCFELLPPNWYCSYRMAVVMWCVDFLL